MPQRHLACKAIAEFSHERLIEPLCAGPAGDGNHDYRLLIARDKGCSFPSCRRPAAWCERHHIIAWEHGGLTELTNLTLLCRYHHQHFQRQSWRCEMIEGLPWWILPRWIDPDQKPLSDIRGWAAVRVVEE